MSFGRLERPQAPQPISEINVTPLVDVMLVLVVILIITAPLLATRLRLDLPQAEGASAQSPARFLSVSVDAGGQIYIEDEPLAAAAAAQRLVDVARQAPQTEVQLRADRGVPYGRVAEVLGLAQAAGLSRIGFVTDPGAGSATAR